MRSDGTVAASQSDCAPPAATQGCDDYSLCTANETCGQQGLSGGGTIVVNADTGQWESVSGCCVDHLPNDQTQNVNGYQVPGCDGWASCGAGGLDNIDNASPGTIWSDGPTWSSAPGCCDPSINNTQTQPHYNLSVAGCCPANTATVTYNPANNCAASCVQSAPANGTISAPTASPACEITCNTGYMLNGSSCVAYAWSDWSGCSASCGPGTQTRSCNGSDGSTNNPASDCGGGSTNRSCNTQACVTPACGSQQYSCSSGTVDTASENDSSGTSTWTCDGTGSPTPTQACTFCDTGYKPNSSGQCVADGPCPPTPVTASWAQCDGYAPEIFYGGTDNYGVTAVHGNICGDAVKGSAYGYNPSTVGGEICSASAHSGQIQCYANFHISDFTSTLPNGSVGDIVDLPTPTSGTDYPVCNPNGGGCGLTPTGSAQTEMMQNSATAYEYQCTSSGWVSYTPSGSSGGGGCGGPLNPCSGGAQN
jgi:hypothetical protein